MPGLDPGIHDEVQQTIDLQFCLRHGIMECRVKPGNDSVEMTCATSSFVLSSLLEL